MDFESIDSLSGEYIEKLYDDNVQMLACFCCSDTYIFGDMSPGKACSDSLAYYCSTIVRKYRCSFGEFYCGSAASGFGGGGVKCISR